MVRGNRSWNTGLTDTRILGTEWDAVYPCMPMDMLVIKPIDTIKIDVEGFELAALRGIPMIIARDLPTIFFEVNLHCLRIVGVNPIDLLDYLLPFGYELTVLDYKPGMRAVFRNSVECLKHISKFGEICDVMARPT